MRGTVKSKKITTSEQTVSQDKYARVVGVQLIAGTDTSKVELKTEGSGGTVKLVITSEGGTNVGDKFQHMEFPHPVYFPDGIYASLSGTDAYCVVQYTEEH